MDDTGQLLRAMLEALASIPLDPPWTVAAIPSAGVVLLADASPDASLMLIEAVAAQFGEIVASDHIDAPEGKRELMAVLIRPADDLVEAAGRLRAAWFLASRPDNSSNDQPF